MSAEHVTHPLDRGPRLVFHLERAVLKRDCFKASHGLGDFKVLHASNLLWVQPTDLSQPPELAGITEIVADEDTCAAQASDTAAQTVKVRS